MIMMAMIQVFMGRKELCYYANDSNNGLNISGNVSHTYG